MRRGEYATVRLGLAIPDGTGDGRTMDRRADAPRDKPAVSHRRDTGRVDESMARVRTPAQRAGDAAEGLVARHLTDLGWLVVGRNVRLGREEVDLIALDPGPPRAVVLVEVRWRARRDFGLPEETLGPRKRAHLRAAAGRLIEGGSLPDGRTLPSGSIRIDLVAVEPSTGPGGEPRLRHHRDALSG
jgi:putative endonuclease